MGLPRAIQAHAQGNLVEAMQHYQRALDQGEHRSPLFQNYGALLRQQGQHAKALEVYRLGLKLEPNDPGLLTNHANLIRDHQPASAISSLLLALRLRLARGEEPLSCSELFRSLISLCRDQGFCAWALVLSRLALLLVGPEPLLLGQTLVLLDWFGESGFPVDQGLRTELAEALERRIIQCPVRQQAELRLALAAHAMSRGELSVALELYDTGLSALRQPGEIDAQESAERQKLLDLNSWNFGCGLLQKQELSRGWQLFEYGLRTPADGPQRWQRSLRKPFPASQLPIWRGEPLAGKRLLLLEEQAIGDVMMFLTLLPALQQEAAQVDLMLGERLVPIYRRCLGDSVRIFTHADAREGRFTPADYDVQCPVGSVCQHRFTRIESYAPRVPMLQSSSERRQQLRAAYCSAGGLQVDRLVGVSWKGGGTTGRIRAKSVSPEQFAQLLRPLPGVRFVSLQYGKVHDQVQQWRQAGIDLIHDPRVDALKDMDLWLDQVATCDAVISVANTTIHGAGGLNLPTQCLLSCKSDWRWFTDPEVTRSYWYPSVGILREDAQQGWASTLAQARAWLEQGAPMPSGPVTTLVRP
jgi:hypothetical protein